jgi:predicted acyltransferase (DUF342 family)
VTGQTTTQTLVKRSDTLNRGSLSVGSDDGSSEIFIRGGVNVTGDLTVSGTSTLTGVVNAQNNVIIQGDTLLQGDLYTQKSAQMKSLLVDENEVISGNLIVSQGATIGGTTTISNDVTIAGKLTVGTVGKPGSVTTNLPLIVGGDLAIGSATTDYKFKLNGGTIECTTTSNVPNMKVSANSLRVEGRLILGENQALWGYDDAVGLANLLRISHSDIKDLIHLGFHDFPLQLYHAEWPGVSDKNITVIKSYISNGSRTEMKELLAYISDLNNITGKLNVSQRTTTQSLTVSSDASISGSLTVGSGPINGLQINGTLIVVNDAVNYNIIGKIDASSLTSGIIDSARLPPLQVTLYTYNAPAPTAAPNWCRIMTLTMSANRFTPLKFNILGSCPASGWPTYFDEDYYISLHVGEQTIHWEK